MSYLPLAPSGTTPLRVLTIAGSDSGGGAGVQADIRTCTLLGVHTLCAVTAVTVQNSLGVKDFHKTPPEVVAAQIAAVCDDIGLQAAKTGMLASAEIIDTVAQSWREHGAGVPLVVDPVSASMHGDRLLDDAALDSLRAELFPLATLVTPNLHEVRLLVGIDVVDSKTQADAARALHALGPKWAMVKGGHLQGSASSTDLLFNGNDFHEFDAPRVDTTNDHGAGDTLAAATACALAHGYPVLDAVSFAKGWVTECLRTSYPLGHGHGPVSPFFRLHPVIDLEQIAGVAHEPDRTPAGVVVLTHGAGGNRESPLLQRLCDEWARQRLACRPLQPALPAETTQGPALGFGGLRSRRHCRGHHRLPRPGRRSADRRRPFLRRPDDVHGGGRERSERRRADVVLLSGAPAGQAGTGPHRTSARASQCRQCSPTARRIRSALRMRCAAPRR